MLTTYSRQSAVPRGSSRESVEDIADGAAFVIETADVAAGIVVRQANGFRFFAADSRFALLDGSIFKTPKAAERAAELMQRAAALDRDARRAAAPGGDRDNRSAVA